MNTLGSKLPTDVLRELGACSDAVEWITELSPDDAWAKCMRGDWMLWLLGRVDDRRNLMALACQCARLASPHDKSGTAVVAIETAERWVAGNADLDEVRRAASAADAAYTDNVRKLTLKKCADIVRDKHPTPPDCVMDLLTKDSGL